MTTLQGRLEQITYQNPENRFIIARVRTRESEGRVTVKGYLAGVMPGQRVQFTGEWEVHPRYGQQFHARSFEVLLPADLDGIRQYLGSGVLKGIGAGLAERLVASFGEKTLEIIENHPGRLTEVPGIGPIKADQIRQAWKDHHALRTIMQFLQENGVMPVHAAKILNVYGHDAIDVLSAEPYALIRDLPEIGFQAADNIARRQGTDANDPQRARACIRHALGRHVNQGHVLMMQGALYRICHTYYHLDPAAIQAAIDDLTGAGEIVADDLQPLDARFEFVREAPDATAQAIYPAGLFHAETGIAEKLKAFLAASSPRIPLDPAEIREQVQKGLAIVLSDEQLSVIQGVLGHRVAVITGGPGTGKTTLIRALVTLFKFSGRRVCLAAPTGRAARRLTQVARCEAVTLHRLLEYNPREDVFAKNRDDPLDTDAVIVDEASMVDTLLMDHLLRAVSLSAVLILVGDTFQLPSVGPGNVLEDLINWQDLPVFKLATIFRQAAESAIVTRAHEVRCGQLPSLDKIAEWQDKDFEFIAESDPKAAVLKIEALCSRILPSRFGISPLDDIQVLTPMHKGDLGTINLNRVLQNALNPRPAGHPARSLPFYPGDKVMHLKNNYQKEVFNGDIGIVAAADPLTRRIDVAYDDRQVAYEAMESDELTAAYAITVHKSQGSEYPVVIIPLFAQHAPLLQRNLLYTAITRGRHGVILVGQPKALAMAVRNDKPLRRLSGLAARLAGII